MTVTSTIPFPTVLDPVVEYAACSAAPEYLIHRYGIIDNTDEAGGAADGPDTATVPFRLWGCQAEVLWALQTERAVIILKARQLGISWVVCGYVLWLCLFAPGRVALLFSKGQDEANELIRRVRVLYERLPGWLKARVPRLTEDNVRSLGWSNDSRVRALPATPSAGASYRADLVLLDEAARGQMKLNGSRVYTSAKPTVDAGGGQIIILSTAEGLGGFFHTQWDRAVRGENNFKPLFFPWWARPGRDQAWYEGVVADADDPALVPENYPANPLEAFIASGRLRFPSAWVTAQSANVREPIPARAWPLALRVRKGWPGLVSGAVPHLWDVPRFRVYTPPQPGRRYVIGADVAEGKDPDGKNDSDYDAAVVLDAETWEEMAFLHGRWEPDVFALYLMALSEPYNQCVIVPERNNHGHSVLATFKHHKFPIARVGTGHDDWPGWLSTEQTKAQGVDLLARALRTNLVTVRSAVALTEMQVYSVLKNGSTGAPSAYHDDAVTAWCVALSWLRHRANRASGSAAPVVGGEATKVRDVLRI